MKRYYIDAIVGFVVEANNEKEAKMAALDQLGVGLDEFEYGQIKCVEELEE